MNSVVSSIEVTHGADQSPSCRSMIRNLEMHKIKYQANIFTTPTLFFKWIHTIWVLKRVLVKDGSTIFLFDSEGNIRRIRLFFSISCKNCIEAEFDHVISVPDFVQILHWIISLPRDHSFRVTMYVTYRWELLWFQWIFIIEVIIVGNWRLQ